MVPSFFTTTPDPMLARSSAFSNDVQAPVAALNIASVVSPAPDISTTD